MLCYVKCVSFPEMNKVYFNIQVVAIELSPRPLLLISGKLTHFMENVKHCQIIDINNHTIYNSDCRFQPGIWDLDSATRD